MNRIAHDSASQTSARRELLLVCVGVVLFWAFSVMVELNERVVTWTRSWERYQLDELPGVLFFLAVALSWFSWRRLQEGRVQLDLRVAAETKLAETLAENRRLSLSHVHVQEDERKQLARELHDELGQHLNAIKIDAVSIRNWSEGQLNEVHAAARAIVQVTDHVQDIVRDMLHRLRPVGLDELGLSAALEHLVEHWRSRHPQTQAALNIEGDVDSFGEAENITLYRFAQEGLTNVVKHARASHVRIVLARNARGVMLSINDDGSGATDWDAAPGLGLVGMRERVEALGGQLEIASSAGQGFLIRAVIPATGRAA
jgi:two-component system, NarL family, sensor histidine kinase UhpB